MYKAMFVDDEYMILQGLQMILPWQELGFEVVHTAKSASEALEYLQEHSVDLLITDIRMPEMNGIDMIRQAQAFGNRFFSIILSGYQEFAFVKQGMALGVRNYLVKPVNKEELRSSVQAIAAELEEQQKLLAEKELYQESSLLLWLNDELNESEYLHLLAQQRVPLAAPFTVLQFNGTAEILQKITTFFQQHDQPLILPGRLDENQVIITAAGPRQQINADLKALAQQLNSTDWQLIMSETINEWENLYKAYEKIKQVQSLQAFYPDLFLQEQTIHVDILERNEELPFLSFNKALTIGDVKTIQHELDKMFAIWNKPKQTLSMFAMFRSCCSMIFIGSCQCFPMKTMNRFWHGFVSLIHWQICGSSLMMCWSWRNRSHRKNAIRRSFKRRSN